MSGIAIALATVVILAGCGFLVSRLLRVSSYFAELGFTFVFGTAVFLLLANSLGYFFPLALSFSVTLLAIGIFDIAALHALTRQHGLVRPSSDTAERRGAGFLFVLTLIVGIAGARYIGSDPWSWQHFPLASTIVAGNFPVHSPIDPESLLRYHYAPAFLAAGFRMLTGLPLTVGFALQPLIGAAGILFFSAAMVRRYRSVQTAVIAALLALAGSGLVWMKFPELQSLFLAFTGFGSFRIAFSGLANLVGSPITTSPLVFLGHRSTATGFPLLFGFLYTLSLLLDVHEPKQSYAYSVVLFLFALSLTLTMEIAFVTLSLAAVALAALFLLLPSTRESGWRMVIIGCTTLLPAFLIAFVHGGVLSGLLVGGHGSFVFHPSFSIMYDTYGNTTSLFSWRLLRDFGFPLFLFPFAAITAWRLRREAPIWLFITVLAFGHFLLPFFFDYTLIRGEMHRFFYAATSLMAVLAGVWVCDRFFPPASFLKRALGASILTFMLLSSSLYLALRLVIPTMRLEPSPLFAPMPPVTTEQSALYDWVRTHTTLDDYFYVRNLTVHFETISDDATVQMRDRILFMTYTGRYTIGPIIYWDYEPAWLALVQQAEETCSADVMRRLHVRYLLVETTDRLAWFKAHCAGKDWNLVYRASEGSEPKIYELR